MKDFRRMYIYKDTHLPAVGWLHGCFMCHRITGQCETFSKKQKEHMIMEHVVYLCPTCKNIIKKNRTVMKEYERNIIEYIDLHSS
jgi:Fe2+ transport system protein B